MRYNPSGELKRLKIPPLIGQGTRDVQVKLAGAKHLAQADPSARLVVIPKMNHVLMKVVGPSRADNLSAYQNPKLPLDKTLVVRLTRFITGHAPSGDSTHAH